MTKTGIEIFKLKFPKPGSYELKTARFYLEKIGPWTISLQFLYNLFVNRSSSRYFWFTWWLCRCIHPPLLNKNMLFDEFRDYGDFIPYGGWCWALTNMHVQIVLRHAANNIKRKTKLLSRPGETCQTGRLLLAPRKLIGLMRFLTFLIMKKY